MAGLQILITFAFVITCQTRVYGFVVTNKSVRSFLDSARRYQENPDEKRPESSEKSNSDNGLASVLQMAPLLVHNPADIEFVQSNRLLTQDSTESLEELMSSSQTYPFAAMLSGSAPYIAAHTGETIVFHIPGDYLESDCCGSLLSDVALARVLGMQIVIVIGCRYDLDSCDLDLRENAHECHNVLKVTDAKTLRMLEEDVGVSRTELERQLNRYMRMHVSGTISDGNVISGNFYTARKFGTIRDKDFEYTGYAPSQQVHSSNIKHHLKNNDIVLLTTVGLSSFGELVNVNGYHLTASVAAALNAYKVVYIANEGSVIKAKNGSPVHEMPLSFVKEVTEYHNVQVHKSGYATFTSASEALEPHAVELLLHLGWAGWALDNGVTRAHIVNPGDGAILEELFTSKNGINTCLYHDRELDEFDNDDLDAFEEDFEEFFEVAEKRA